MVNTNNKFTLNKKGFALSLACAGLLATSAGAAVTANDGGNWVTSVNNSNYNTLEIIKAKFYSLFINSNNHYHTC